MTDQTLPTTLPRRRGLGRGLDALFEDSEKRAAIVPDRAPLSSDRAAAMPDRVGTGVDRGMAMPDEGASDPSRVSDMVAASVPRQTANMSFQDASSASGRSGSGVMTAPAMPSAAVPANGRLMMPIAALCPGVNQPRTHFDDKAIEELAASIKIHGVIQPLLVRPLPEGRESWAGATHEIIAGERRWRAAQRAGVHDVPVVIDMDMDDRTALQVGIIENVQRADLNPIEEAEGYDRLIQEFGYTAERVADLIGKSRPHVANLCRLLQLPATVRAMVVQGELSAGHARALLGSSDVAALADRVIKGKLSVRQTESLVRQEARTAQKNRTGQGTLPIVDDMHMVALQKELTDTIGLKVEIQMDKGQATVGTVMLRFNDLDQMDLILKRIRGE